MATIRADIDEYVRESGPPVVVTSVEFTRLRAIEQAAREYRATWEHKPGQENGAWVNENCNARASREPRTKGQKVTITIKTSNAAFSDGNREYEIARILREIADRIESGAAPTVAYDINGNRVATIKGA